MSTICKLDPRIRQTRAYRRAVCITPVPLGIKQRAEWLAILMGLNYLRRMSHYTGAEKNAIFSRVVPLLAALS